MIRVIVVVETGMVVVRVREAGLVVDVVTADFTMDRMQ